MNIKIIKKEFMDAEVFSLGMEIIPELVGQFGEDFNTIGGFPLNLDARPMPGEGTGLAVTPIEIDGIVPGDEPEPFCKTQFERRGFSRNRIILGANF